MSVELLQIKNASLSLREKRLNTHFFLVRIQENMDQKKIRIWTLLAQSVFYHKVCVFIICIFFLWWSIKMPQQNINQSKKGIGDKKLLVELYERYF